MWNNNCNMWYNTIKRECDIMCDCIDCTYLALQQPLRLLCTCDGHNSVMVDGDLALKHLYKECPLKKGE